MAEQLIATERLPLRLREDPRTKAVSESMSLVAAELFEAALSVSQEYSPQTADWGLPAWERLVGITPAPGSSQEARRSAVTTRLRGSGTCNAAMISRHAESVTGYSCVVVEDFAAYTFSLILVGDTPGFIDIDAQTIIGAVEEIKPAHLKFVIEAITWRDLESMAYTWQMMEDQGLTWEMIESKVMVQRRDAVDGA